MEKLTWVYVEGVFDLFHSGHVNFLKAAREQGDRLIVALVSDQDVCTYKPAPIVSFEERKKLVSSCRFVDKLLDAPALIPTTLSHLDFLGAEFVCHGDDMGSEELTRWYGELIPAGRLKVVKYSPGISSREIVSKIAGRLRDGTLRDST